MKYRHLQLSEPPEPSLPSRERGLKYVNTACAAESFPVAPLAGARIEIKTPQKDDGTFFVAPLAGARIEIVSDWGTAWRVRVAPLAGARIEMRDMLVSL